MFENGPGGLFQKSLKRGVRFQTILKKGSIFKLSLKKYPTRGPGPGWTGARAQDPGPNQVGYLFKNSLRMDHFLNSLKTYPPF